MKKEKWIIIGLIIVVIALIAGIAFMFLGGDASNNGSNVSEGMEIFNFDSLFTMEVPENTKFLKSSLLGVEDGIYANLGISKSYFSKNNEFCVRYIHSGVFDKNAIIQLVNGSAKDDVTFEESGNMIIAHNKNSDGKVGNDYENTNFTDMVVVYKGLDIVVLSGNDADLIKSMADTIEFREI